MCFVVDCSVIKIFFLCSGLQTKNMEHDKIYHKIIFADAEAKACTSVTSTVQFMATCKR